MKNLILLINLFFYITVSGQNLQIRSATGTILDGQTLTHNGLSTDAEIIADGYYVHNLGTSTISVRCKREEISVVPSTENALCWAICSSPFTAGTMPVLVAPGGADTIPGGDSLNVFALHYYPLNNSGTSLFKVTFYNQSLASDTAVFFIQFDAAVSVNENSISKNSISAFPNPATDIINFYFENLNRNGSLKIFNSLGIEVLKSQLSNSTNFTTDVSELPNGIYYCSLFSNEESILTKKIIVQH